MSADEKKLFLLDSMALVYRGHFALMRNPRMTSKGMNTSAVFVFANSLVEMLEKHQPTHLAAVFDSPEPTHRHQEYREYKAQRDEMPEDLSQALPYVFKLCDSFNVPVIRHPGWEADDIIGTYARQAEVAGFTTYMVTPDKDYGQLVDEHTFMYKPGSGGGEGELMGVAEVLERWQIERIDQLIDILGLMGDASDNIPGVPGVGEKTAQKLIADFGNIENLYENLDQIKGKRRQNLEDNHEQALLSKKLVTIDCQVPVEHKLDDLAVRPRNDAALKELFAELEFSALGKRIFGEEFAAGAPGQLALGFGGEGGEALKTAKDVEHDYQLVDTPEKRAALIEKLQQVESFCFDSETDKLDPKTCHIIGLAFAVEEHAAYYVPIPQDEVEGKAVLEEFRGLFSNVEIEKIGHNLKYDLNVLLWHGVEVEGPFFDTMIAAHLAVPQLRRSMDALANDLLEYQPISITELIGERGEEQRSMSEVPLDQLVEYAAEDADITLQLAGVLRPLIAEKSQERVFYEVESPLISVLATMEHVGIRMVKETLQELSVQLDEELRSAAARVFELAGEEFNLNSPKQLGDILFDKLQLDPAAKRTGKTKQYSTNEQVLRRLAMRHEIVERILHHRSSAKLKSTYVDMLPGAVFADTGRVHTHYEQAVTATGRMQSSNPNLQNIPVRTEQGREIRRAFVPGDEHYTLLSADYSQIELRIIAALSEDEGLMGAFRNGEDIHTSTATRIYEVPADGVTDEMRRKAKTVNFGIIYGISAFGLAGRLDISRNQAAALIEQYFMQYPGVKGYLDQTIEFARQHGYVETVLGRRRYLRDINSRNATARQGEERNAINAPIQGSAADMIKLAMSRIHCELRQRQLKTRMLLQVHDELVFDLQRDEMDVVPSLVEEAMKEAMPIAVPIVVEMGTGETWVEAH